MKVELAITGAGLLSPIGHTALACMHAVRSNQSGLSLLRLPDRVRNWVAGGKIPQWSPYGGHRQWELLAATALQQAWGQANRAAVLPAETPIALVLGRPDAGRPSPVFPGTGFDVSAWAESTLGRAVTHVDIVQAGACNGHAGLRLAAQRFAAGTAEACLIGAADSQAQLRVTRWHEDNLRLKCSYVTDGLMPSEAAAFVVVEPASRALQRGAHILAHIDAVVGGTETAHVLSDLPNNASALTQVTRGALSEAGIGADDLGMVWSDLNGESYKAREWAFASVRLGLRDSSRLMHPADCHGDLGAATDTHLLGLAALAQATAWSNLPMLVFAGADNGLRAASILRQGTTQSGVATVSVDRPWVRSSKFKLPDVPTRPQDFRDHRDPTKTWFLWQGRQSHQDDIAAICYQRRAMLADPAMPWPRLAEPEQRLLQHLDAIIAGGPDAMAFHAAGMASEEDGVAFGAALLVGQIPSPENLGRLESTLATAQGPHFNGLLEGLMHAPMSPGLQATLLRWLESEHPALRCGALRLLSRNRIAVPPPAGMKEYLGDEMVALEVAEAGWRLGWSSLASALKDLLGHESIGLRQSALTAMLCFVPDRAALFCRSRLNDNAAFGGALATGLALCGNLDDVAPLLRQATQDPSDAAAIGALGILGHAQALPLLIEQLQSADEAVAQAADQALALISGRRAPSGLPAAQAWRRWFAREGSALDAATRWRRGKAFTVAACIDELADPQSPLVQRRRAQRELARWAGTRTNYEPDAFAALQTEALNTLRA